MGRDREAGDDLGRRRGRRGWLRPDRALSGHSTNRTAALRRRRFRFVASTSSLGLGSFDRAHHSFRIVACQIVTALSSIAVMRGVGLRAPSPAFRASNMSDLAPRITSVGIFRLLQHRPQKRRHRGRLPGFEGLFEIVAECKIAPKLIAACDCLEECLVARPQRRVGGYIVVAVIGERLIHRGEHVRLAADPLGGVRGGRAAAISGAKSTSTSACRRAPASSRRSPGNAPAERMPDQHRLPPAEMRPARVITSPTQRFELVVARRAPV